MQVLEPSELSEDLIKKKLVGSKILDEVLTKVSFASNESFRAKNQHRKASKRQVPKKK
jgi:hypothetical protein